MDDLALACGDPARTVSIRMKDRTHDELIRAAVLNERARCIMLADTMASAYEHSAKTLRAEGTYEVRAIFPWRLVTCVTPRAELQALAKDQAARGCRMISKAIRENWTKNADPTAKIVGGATDNLG